MRVISYEIAGCGPRPGMLVEEGWVLDLNRAVVTGGMRRGGQDLDLAGLIALHDKETPCLSILNETMLGSRYDEALVPRASTTLRAPIGKPRKNIFCVGRNYLDHVAEGDRVRGVSTDLPAYPQFFTKPPTGEKFSQFRDFLMGDYIRKDDTLLHTFAAYPRLRPGQNSVVQRR